MIDELQCELALPDASVLPGTTLQTSSLYGGMESFTITREGRLVHHAKQWHMAKASGSAIPLMTATALGDADTEYHGDIRFGGKSAGGEYVEFVARFTNGRLEWIKQYEALPEQQKRWFESRD